MITHTKEKKLFFNFFFKLSLLLLFVELLEDGRESRGDGGGVGGW